MDQIDLQTTQRTELIDITSEVKKIVKKNKMTSGLVLVYSPHTTAGITINENVDPNVRRDISEFLKKRIPQNAGFQHGEGNSDAHIKGTLVNFSQGFIVENGEIQLGTWQGIYFCEFDGPRERRIWIKCVP